MIKRSTIKQLCRGRLIELPARGEATREERIAIQCANLQIIREEIGAIPFFYPQSEAEVPDWIDKHYRTTGRFLAAIKAISKLPDDAMLPSPFAF